MSTPLAAPLQRLAYVDWMRGLACVMMFQAHCYDSWLNPEARKTVLYRWSQELSTLPALIFLFLCGVSFVLVTERLRQEKRPAMKIFKTALLRGAEIFGWGLLLRVQEFVLGYPKSPWTDLFRVDVLNILGVSLILMALFWRVTTAPSVIPSGGADQRWRNRTIALALLVAAVIAVVTPPLWTTHRLQISSLDAGVLYQRRAHLRCAATVALLHFSMVWICICGAGVRLIHPLGLRAEEGSVGGGARGRRRSCGLRFVGVVGLFRAADLCGLRLLA